LKKVRGLDNELEVVEGMQFDRAYLIAVLHHNQQAERRTRQAAGVLVDKKISNIANCSLAGSHCRRAPPAADRCGRLEGEAWPPWSSTPSAASSSRRRQGAGFRADRAKGMLQDIAILTGGHVISDESLRSRSHTERPGEAKEDPGGEERTPPSSTATARPLTSRPRRQHRAQIEEATSDYAKEKLQERVANFGGVAVIKVGAANEIE